MEIYQKLWNGDRNRFSVSRKLPNGGFEKPAADILLDEQIKASGRRSVDLADNPLFYSVNKSKLQTDINGKFIRLLNNYIVNFRESEVYTEEELKEMDDFLEAIYKTEVMALAVDYIEQELKESIKEQFKEKMFDLWFNLYTNWYRGRSTRFCSGFEHVFVGEGQYGQTNKEDVSLGEITGYHNWIKFLLDEKTGRVNYLGYNYGLNDNQGPDNPNVVTLQMLWELKDLNGNVITELFKPKGGFFVGTSPECEIAMGTVAFFESKKGLFSNRDRKQVRLCSGDFNLVLYRSVNRNGSRGDHIRSFYPEYIGSAGSVRGIIPVRKIETFVKMPPARLRRTLRADASGDLIASSGAPDLASASRLRGMVSGSGWKLSFENWK